MPEESHLGGFAAADEVLGYVASYLLAAGEKVRTDAL